MLHKEHNAYWGVPVLCIRVLGTPPISHLAQHWSPWVPLQGLPCCIGVFGTHPISHLQYLCTYWNTIAKQRLPPVHLFRKSEKGREGDPNTLDRPYTNCMNTAKKNQIVGMANRQCTSYSHTQRNTLHSHNDKLCSTHSPRSSLCSTHASSPQIAHMALSDAAHA